MPERLADDSILWGKKGLYGGSEPFRPNSYAPGKDRILLNPDELSVSQGRSGSPTPMPRRPSNQPSGRKIRGAFGADDHSGLDNDSLVGAISVDAKRAPNPPMARRPNRLGRAQSTSVARGELRRRAVGAGIFVGACRWAPMLEANEFAVRREMREIVRGEREAADSIERLIQQRNDPNAVDGFRPDGPRQHIALTRDMEREIGQETVRHNQPKFTAAEMDHVEDAYFHKRPSHRAPTPRFGARPSDATLVFKAYRSISTQ